MPVIPLIAGGAGLAMNLIAQQQAGKAAKESDKLIDQRLKENKSWYNSEKNKDFTDTAAAKGVFNQVKQRTKRQGEAANNSAARSGATTDQVIAQKKGIQESNNDAVSRIASMGTAYKQGIRRDYLSNLNNYTGAKIASKNKRAESWMNVASNAGKLIGSGIEAYAQQS